MTSPDTGAFLRRHAWTLLAVALAGLDLSRHLFVGWVAHDEGTLALSGALVRQGLWPHRDFVDVYSGGMALLNAAAQFLFGDDLRALRYPLFAAALGWVALMAACLRRFVPPPAAAALALFAFLWGPPLYAAPMPSWYLLFTATVVLWCTLRWTETADRKWLFMAGLGIGMGLLLKINALFLLAGVGSFLLADRTDPTMGETAPSREGMLVRALGLGVGAYGIVAVVLAGWPVLQALPLLLPIVGLAIVGLARRWSSSEPLGTLVRGLGPQVLALGAGIAAVTAPFLLLYMLSGAGGALTEGVLLLPFRRATSARMLPPLVRGTELLVFGAILLACYRALPQRTARALAVLFGVIGAWAAWRGHSDDSFLIFKSWQVARVFLAGGLLLAAGAGLRRDPDSRPLLAVAFITAWSACVQYPFAAPVYFAYVAPLAVIVLAALVSSLRVPPVVPSAVALSAALVTLAVNHGQGINTLGFRHLPQVNVPLDLPHGGLEIPLREAVAYEDIAATLDRWGARRIVAAPDSPEIYYLTGRPLVGREFYEFTAPHWNADVLAERIVTSRAEAVVIKTFASFSPVAVDSVVLALRGRVRTDTLIDRFRVLRLEAPDASP
jgi:dolichyl-phosphate-mannose-protein mannosyltransferase